ncbi:MAG: SseB family protein [Sciscionella sp.]
MSQAHSADAPAITDRMRSDARANPNSWLYIVDPAYTDAPDIPDWAVVGAYPVNEFGEIEEGFRRNDDYRQDDYRQAGEGGNADHAPEPSTPLDTPRHAQAFQQGATEGTGTEPADPRPDVVQFPGDEPAAEPPSAPRHATGEVWPPVVEEAPHSELPQPTGEREAAGRHSAAAPPAPPQGPGAGANPSQPAAADTGNRPPAPSAARRPLAGGDPNGLLEGLLKLANTGRADQSELLPTLLDAQLLLYGRSEGDSGVLGFLERNTGQVMVCVCTSPRYVPNTWPGWRTVRGRDLVPALGESPLVINPAGPVCAIIAPEHLRAAL